MSLLPPRALGGAVDLGITFYPRYRLFAMLAAGLLILAVWLFLERTRLGAIIRANIKDKDMVAVLWININRVHLHLRPRRLAGRRRLMTVSDRITVMHFGRVLAEGVPPTSSEATRSARHISARRASRPPAETRARIRARSGHAAATESRSLRVGASGRQALPSHGELIRSTDQCSTARTSTPTTAPATSSRGSPSAW
jgi:hypothetical protein